MHVSDCSSLKRGFGPPNLHHWQMAWGYWVTEEGIIPRAHFKCGHGNNKHGIMSQEAEPGTTESSGQGALPREHSRVQSRNFSCLRTRGPSQQDINAARDRLPLCISHCHSVEVPMALILSLFHHCILVFHHCILVEYVCWAERMRGGLGSFFFLVYKLPDQMKPHVLSMECWAYHSEILDPELAIVTRWTLDCLSWDGECVLYARCAWIFEG